MPSFAIQPPVSKELSRHGNEDNFFPITMHSNSFWVGPLKATLIPFHITEACRIWVLMTILRSNSPALHLLFAMMNVIASPTHQPAMTIRRKQL